MFHNNQIGIIMPLAALLIVLILGLGALVIDTSQTYANQTKIKNAVDFSALAGISQLNGLSTIAAAKNTALNYINDNLTMSLPSFIPITLANEDLSIQVGVYDFNSMTFTVDETNPTINSIRISYTYPTMTFLAPILMVSTIQVSDSVISAKQTAGRMAPGGGFPLAIQSSLLAQARTNSNMVDLVQTGTANSFFTAFMDSTANANDIKEIIDYFINQTNGIEPPALEVGQEFQINNGSLSSIYMGLDSTYLKDMIFVLPIVSLPTSFSSMVRVEGFIGLTINDIYMAGNDYHIAGTVIPGYIDNRWSGLTIAAGPGNIEPEDKSLLATSYGLVK